MKSRAAAAVATRSRWRKADSLSALYNKVFIRSFTNKIAELQKQLAEAEEHIDNLELQLREQYQLVDEKDEQLAEKEKDKISFCIEQLKKVKEKIIKTKDSDCGDKYKECWDIIIDIIIDYYRVNFQFSLQFTFKNSLLLL